MSSPARIVALLLAAAGALLVAAFSVIPLAGIAGPENPIVEAALGVSLPSLATLLALALPAGLGARLGRGGR